MVDWKSDAETKEEALTPVERIRKQLKLDHAAIGDPERKRQLTDEEREAWNALARTGDPYE